MDASLPISASSGAAAVQQGGRREGAPGDAPAAAGSERQDRVTLSDEARAGAGRELSSEQQRQVAELKRRDVQVRAHEAAHQAAGGGLAGGASFTYELGPDGRRYAVGGEVPVSMRRGGTPDETVANARQVRRAALAPADPSAQDLSVAAEALSMEQAATAEKARRATRAYAALSGSPAPARSAEAASVAS